MAISDITPLPDPPSRGDAEANFVNKANAFLGSLPTFQSELNTYAGEANAQADAVQANRDATDAARDAALAATNYQGEWSTLTGSLNKPASTLHDGYFWALNADVADVTAEEPGTSAVWDPIVAQRGRIVESLSDITSLSSLDTSALVDGQSFRIQRFWQDGTVISVPAHWDATADKTTHNGVTRLDPGKASELNNSTKEFGSWFTPAGSGQGILIIDVDTITPWMAGALGGGNDDYLPQQAVFDLWGSYTIDYLDQEFCTSQTIEAPEADGIRVRGVKGKAFIKAHPDKGKGVDVFRTSVSSAPLRNTKNLCWQGLGFDGSNLPVNRWLQDWNDNSPISDPENDYFANGGGIGNTGANYIADDDYIATSQSGVSSTPLALANTAMPLTKSTSGSPDYAAARRVRVVSSGDDSAVEFTVSGTAFDGSALSETITGANAGVAEGKKWFKTVSSITPSSATASTVTVGIEEYDAGSSASAGRRNPYYTISGILARFRLCEDSKISGCVIKDHVGLALEEAGGKNVTIDAVKFSSVGKNDGAFPAIWTQSFGTPGAGQAFYQDSQNTIVSNCEAENLERSFCLFTPTRGGKLFNCTVDGWGESCVFISDKLHFSGGHSEIYDNKFSNGTITDIVNAGVEANGIDNLDIYDNTIEGSQGEAFGVPGCQNMLLKDNTTKNCGANHVIPYGPFSERYSFNVGLPPIAGDTRVASTDLGVYSIGTLNGKGNDWVSITGNKVVEDRADYPSVFKQTKSGGDNLSSNTSISGTILRVPASMRFLNESIPNVWDDNIGLSVFGNMGHPSESPVIVTEQILSGETGTLIVDVGFRPRYVEVFAVANNGSLGQSSAGSFSWNRAGSRNDWVLAQSVTDGTGQNFELLPEDVFRTRDTTGVVTALAEFVKWTELGFELNVQTVTQPTNIRFVCHP